MKPKHLACAALQGWHGRQAIRRLRTLEGRLDTLATRLALPFVFQGRGFFRSIRPKQSQWEIAQLYSEVGRRQPRSVLEIGTYDGGTLYLWCQAAHPEATVLSVDLPPGAGGYRACRERLYQAFARSAQTLTLLRGDSHAAATLAAVRERLRERPVDFLFIDGDHTHAGVRQDFEMYGPLVAAGGLVAFHDTVRRADRPGSEVWRFWAELKARRPQRTHEWIDPTPGGFQVGIGVLEWEAGA